jgi:hypothetical protein
VRISKRSQQLAETDATLSLFSEEAIRQPIQSLEKLRSLPGTDLNTPPTHEERNNLADVPGGQKES